MGHGTSDIGYHRHWTLDIGHRTSTSTSDIGHRTSDIGYKLLHFWWFPGLVKKNSMETWPPVLKVTKSSTFGVFFFSKKGYFGTKSSTFGVFFSQNPPLLVTKTWKTSTFFFFFLMDFSSKPEKPPLLVTKTWKTSTFGVFFVSKWIFLQNLHF